MSNEREWNWFVEWQTPYEGHLHGVKDILLKMKTRFQRIEIVELYRFGKTLIIDGKVQSTIIDEYIYHETIVHPAMFTHNNPIKILVIGGGEGAVNRELLKHNTVESIYMVDIDNDAINIFKKYLYEWHRNSFSDPRVRLIIDDGRSFLEKSREKFDVIIIDITDPLKSSPSRLLYTFEFYKHVYEKLNDDGLMVTQATSVSYTPENYAIIYNTLKKVFPIVRPFYTYIPSFDSQWGFMMASKKYDPMKISQNELRDRINKRIQGEFKLYDEKYHFKIFILPKDIKKFLEENVKISTDKNPICMPI